MVGEVIALDRVIYLLELKCEERQGVDKDTPTQVGRVVDMWSLYLNVEGTIYLAYALHGFLAHPSLDLTMFKSPAQRWIVETPRE